MGKGDSHMVVLQAYALGPLQESASALVESWHCPQSLAEGFLEEELQLNAELSQVPFAEPEGSIYNPVAYLWGHLAWARLGCPLGKGLVEHWGTHIDPTPSIPKTTSAGTGVPSVRGTRTK